MRSLFITVEGTEGVGKTSNINFIADFLRTSNIHVVETREPGGTKLGESIRSMLLDPKNKMADDTELLLMFAARAQHLTEVIEPALANDSWVVCDRFTDATYAYQGGGRGLPMEKIASLETWVQGERKPDLTILLDIDVQTGLKRASDRSTPDRFEQEQVEFFERVRQCYLSRAQAEPDRFIVIDTTQSLDKVQDDIAKTLRKYVKPKHV